MTERPLSYALHQERRNGTSRTVARLWCAGCGEHLDVTVTGHNNPALIETKAIQAGWTFHRNLARKIRCPACARRPEPTQGPAPRPHPPTPTKGDAMARPAVPPAVPAATVAGKGVPEIPAAQPRDLTPDERTKARLFLDGVFDDQRGCYLEEWSDRTAGEHLGIPWASLARYRDIAFGPIRLDPEVLAIKEEVARLSAVLNQTQDALRQLGERVAKLSA